MSATIEDLIKDRIEDIDLPGMVREEIRRLLSGKISEETFRSVREEVSKIVSKEINIQMSKGVHSDDGWGNKKDYNSFEELFRETFIKKMNDSWEVKREIKKIIEQRVDDLVKASQAEVVAGIANNLLKLNEKKA